MLQVQANLPLIPGNGEAMEDYLTVSLNVAPGPSTFDIQALKARNTPAPVADL
jgi:hypothetical protein